MKLTLLGKITILIVAVGLAFGGYRFWKQSSLSGLGAGSNRTTQAQGNRTGSKPNASEGGTTTGGTTGRASSGDDRTSSTQGRGGGGVEIPFVITAAKKDWVSEQVERFNATHRGQYRIVAEPIPSREAMHSILEGKTRPVLWSPGSPIWPTRLAQAWKQKRGTSIVDLNNPNGYRVFLRSPLVFMTTREKAKFLRPLLSTPACWVNLRELSMGRKRTPFGPFNFSHADPLTSSSGMLTLGLALYDYSKRTGSGGDLAALARSPKFLNYLGEMERGLIYDSPAEKGTTALTNAFLKDLNRYDAITGYESAALAAARSHPNLAVIYPSPTAVSEHAVSLLSAEWVSPQQRAGAEEFIRYLGGEDALRAGVKTYFRPAQPNGDISLNPQLSRYSGQGFEQSFAPIELPPYEALNTAAYEWTKRIAR